MCCVSNYDPIDRRTNRIGADRYGKTRRNRRIWSLNRPASKGEIKTSGVPVRWTCSTDVGKCGLGSVREKIKKKTRSLTSDWSAADRLSRPWNADGFVAGAAAAAAAAAGRHHRTRRFATATSAKSRRWTAAGWSSLRLGRPRPDRFPIQPRCGPFPWPGRRDAAAARAPTHSGRWARPRPRRNPLKSIKKDTNATWASFGGLPSRRLPYESPGRVNRRNPTKPQDPIRFIWQ